MTKQEKTALNMARFIRSQTLTLLEKLNELDADEQADNVNRFTTTPMSFTAAASHASGMTVKTCNTCSSRRRSQLACERMPGADKPVRA
ncbi:TPA: Rop family plasmid primer RNA-binding protein, partial [Escherichia coli]